MKWIVLFALAVNQTAHAAAFETQCKDQAPKTVEKSLAQSKAKPAKDSPDYQYMLASAEETCVWEEVKKKLLSNKQTDVCDPQLKLDALACLDQFTKNRGIASTNEAVLSNTILVLLAERMRNSPKADLPQRMIEGLMNVLDYADLEKIRNRHTLAKKTSVPHVEKETWGKYFDSMNPKFANFVNHQESLSKTDPARKANSAKLRDHYNNVLKKQITIKEIVSH